MMELLSWRFAFCVTALSFMCSVTAAYERNKKRDRLKALEDGIYFIRQDIGILFDKTDKLNMSVFEACGQCVSSNETSCSPVMNHDGIQDMVKVNSSNMLVKYHSLINAFVSEKKISRELQNQQQKIEDFISENDSKVQDRLRSLEEMISDIRYNMTSLNVDREVMDNERDRESQSRLKSMEDTISARDLALEHRLLSTEDIIWANKRLADRRDGELLDQLRSMKKSIEENISNIQRDLHNSMTSFMTKIGERIDERLSKPDRTTVSVVNMNCRTAPVSGVYTLYLPMSPVTVYCDQDTDGGAWIVFMRRQDGSVNFTRSWSDYKHGFGGPDGEFWAGNEFLFTITKTRPLQLRIDMEDFDGNTAFAVYEEFQVGAEGDKYRLHVSGYSGTAGDSLIDKDNLMGNHAGMQFSTFDSDNDKYRNNCAANHKAGWWYNECFRAKLTGLYSHDKNIPYAEGIIWSSWKDWYESLKRVEMKIR